MAKVGVSLSESERAQIQRLVEKVGQRVAARCLSVNADTMARGAAGFPINPSTAELIRLKLIHSEDVEAPAAA